MDLICVKRVGKTALAMGINTIIDFDLTDLFFQFISPRKFFNIKKYNPNKFKKHMINELARYGEKYAEKQFSSMYASVAYCFDEECKKRKEKE